MHLLARPHHDGSTAYVATQAPALGDRVEVRVRVPHAAGVDTVWLRTTPDAEPAVARLVEARRDDVEAWWVGEVLVRNPVTHYRFLCTGPDGTYGWVTQAGWVERDVTDAHDFSLLTAPAPPDWVADAALYQVFPDRFARSDRDLPLPDWAEPAAWDDPVATEWPATMHQFYRGDLWGAAERVDHLADLGVTGAYLNPVFPAQEQHRYCATSFDEVDPALGGDDALAAFSAVMHERGLRLVGDLTLNHSGSGHPWFAAAQADPDAEEASWYHFTSHPDAYEAWAGVRTLPKFDLRAPGLRARLVDGPDSVVARWLRPPVALDGWRVDAANMAGHCGEVDERSSLLDALSTTARAVREDVYLLAEHCHDATDVLADGRWHGTMNYTGFTRPVWSWLRRDDGTHVDYLGLPIPLPRTGGHALAGTVDEVCGAMPWRTRVGSLNLLGSHDTTRWRHVAGDRASALVGFGILATFPGVPSLLYGDELGLAGGSADAAREPMPWDHVERWDTATLEAVRALLHLRRDTEALRRGGFRWVHVGADVLVWLRETADERVLVRAARAAHEPLTLPVALLGAGGGTSLHGGRDLTRHADVVVLPSEGPAVDVWRLGG